MKNTKRLNKIITEYLDIPDTNLSKLDIYLPPTYRNIVSIFIYKKDVIRMKKIDKRIVYRKINKKEIRITIK